MDTDRTSRIEALFHAALERAPAERPAFLAAACDDSGLRREVESLLLHASHPDSILATHAGGKDQPLIGRDLGIYRVQARLGAGAMGEVYRARDTRLGRDVAIKMLPAAFERDRDRLARFAREARLLASLNHPNIGSIYGLEETDGRQFLVLELVPGDTLADIVRARGGKQVRLEEALNIAGQIADALQAAHEQGVIHRDLKPANIKLTPARQVKVLDFGLGKGLAEPPAAVVDAGATTVRRDEATETGMIMGTPAYMSPEQARGQAVDERSDIWAFGCVLFELLTGRRAFEGATTSDTLAHVLERTPDWNALPAPTPSSVRRLLLRCLQKDPRKRLHDIADARLDLQEALAPEGSAMATGAAAPAASRRSGAALTGWAAAVAFAAVAAFLWLTRPAPSVPPLIQMSESVPNGLSHGPFLAHVPLALSSDGKRLVYAALDGTTSRLYLRSLDQLGAVAIPNTEGAFGFFFSPDGRSIGFATENDKLKTVSLDGGVPVTICDAPWFAGAAWGSDDRIVFSSETNLWRVPATGGTPEQITRATAVGSDRTRLRVDGLVAHRYPSVLPDGSVLFTIGREEREYFSSDFAAAVLLPDGSTPTVQENASSARYLPPGYLLFVRYGTLMAAPFDAVRHKVTGTPVAMVDGFGTSPLGSAPFAVSDSGALAYAIGRRQMRNMRTLVWVDPKSGRETPLPFPEDHYTGARLSSDAQTVALRVRRDTNEKTGHQLFVGDSATGRLQQLSELSTLGFTWSRDGKRVLFRSSDGAIYERPADLSAPEKLVFDAKVLPAGTTAGTWSSDGQRVVLGGVGAGRDGNGLWMLTRPSRPDAAQATVLLDSLADEALPVFSPDDRWIAYASSEKKRSDVYVHPSSGPGPRRSVSAESGSVAFWINHAIVYRQLTKTAEDRVMIATAETALQPDIGVPRIFAEVKGLFQDVTRDGKRILMFKEEGSADFDPQRQINWTLGWIQTVQQRTGRK